MKLALMQPYFFPYIGYFQLIDAVDRFVLFDEAQYINQGWMNRNRVLKDGGGSWCYIHMPVTQHDSRTRIRDVHAIPGLAWKQRILRQIGHYKAAPFYDDVSFLLKEAFEYDATSVTALNRHFLLSVCAYLGMECAIETLSALQLDYSAIAGPGEWGLAISRQLGAAEYVNPIGGAGLFNKQAFESAGINLAFLTPELEPYDQMRPEFEPALSIIDVLMFNHPSRVRAMMRVRELST